MGGLQRFHEPRVFLSRVERPDDLNVFRAKAEQEVSIIPAKFTQGIVMFGGFRCNDLQGHNPESLIQSQETPNQRFAPYPARQYRR
jgi:hypothetical protein